MALRATEQSINTGTAASKAFLNMLGVFAEFESKYARRGRPKASPQQRHCTQGPEAEDQCRVVRKRRYGTSARDGVALLGLAKNGKLL